MDSSLLFKEFLKWLCECRKRPYGCPTYDGCSSDEELVFGWYLEAIRLMRSLKANSERMGCTLGSKRMVGLFEGFPMIGTICSSLIEPVSPSLSVLLDEELSLLLDPFLGLFLGLFLAELSSNIEGPKCNSYLEKIQF